MRAPLTRTAQERGRAAHSNAASFTFAIVAPVPDQDKIGDKPDNGLVRHTIGVWIGQESIAEARNVYGSWQQARS